MAHSADTLFLRGIDFFSDVVAGVAPSGWARPTPCAGWRAVDVLGHVGAAVRFGTTLLRDGEAGWRPVDPPGDAVDGEPAEWWEQIAASAQQAVSGVDLSAVVEAPRGPRSVGEGLSFPALDLFVHAWDLGHSAGFEVTIPPEVVQFGHALLDHAPAAQLRSPTVFADAVAVPAGATSTDAFVAWTGRNPAWAP